MTTLAELVMAAHRDFAARPAVPGAMTFAELGARAGAVATGLARRGLRPGDRVLLALDNRAETLAVEHGLWLGGFVRVAVSTRLHPREIAAIAADCTAAAIVCEPAVAADLPPAQVLITAGPPLDDLLAGPAGVPVPRRDPDELVALMYTSGSTGAPKGARVTSGAWVAMVETMWRALPEIGPSDVWLHAAPMSHFGGSVGSAYTLAGAAAVPLARFSAAEVLAAVQRHRVTAVALVPTMLDRLVAAAGPADVSSLRAVVYGAAPISAPALRRARERFGDVLYQFYGLSEALAPLTVLTPADHRVERLLSSAGRPVDPVRLSVVDGEVVVDGPQVMPGYWNAGPRPQGPWRTGDLGRLDGDGYLHLDGRRSEAIITGGFHVHPVEVERAIATLDAVAEVAVLGVPDPRWGETVAAAVVPRPGHEVTEQDVRAVCEERLAGYKKPRRIVFAPALPRAAVGKVSTRRIRSWFEEENCADGTGGRARPRFHADDARPLRHPDAGGPGRRRDQGGAAGR